MIGLLGYWHILALYFAIALPMMSRPSVGSHSPRLHFCREPISHLTCVGGNHPCMSVAAQPVSLWETTPHRRPYDARIMPTAAVHRYQLGLYPSEVSLGSRDFLVLGRPVEHFGTKRWDRTNDIRDMSPLFCRLNYLGICRAPYVSIGAILPYRGKPHLG